MKISDVLKNTTERLRRAGIDTANLDAKLLLCKFLKKDKLFLVVNSEKEIEIDEKFMELVSRREKHEPMQYILGKAEFYGLDFKVNKNVLIPRPDTEVLVEKVISFVKNNSYAILDIGTGSGCIPISILVNCPNAKAYAADISADAIEVAKENAKLNNVDNKINFLNIDILNDFPDFSIDCIVSNPPYIEEEVIPTLMEDVRNFEPYIALSGGADGLVFYRRIAQEGYKILRKGGLIAFEVGYTQAKAVEEILKKNGFTQTEIIKDLAGIERIVSAIK